MKTFEEVFGEAVTEYERHRVPMWRKVLYFACIMAFIFFVAVLLTGCGKNHTVTTPKEKSTTTITKTVKTDRPVPVLATQTTIQTQTQTFDSSGKPLPPPADLHKAEVKTIPEPGK